MENDIFNVQRTDEELSFSEAASYAEDAQAFKEVHQVAQRAAKNYLCFEGKKTIGGLLDLVGTRISVFSNLTQERKVAVMNEIKREYSKEFD